MSSISGNPPLLLEHRTQGKVLWVIGADSLGALVVAMRMVAGEGNSRLFATASQGARQDHQEILQLLVPINLV